MMNILAQPTISLEILHQLPINCRAQTVTTLKENMFILCSQEDQQGIKVYDRNSMTEVTNIWLPATHLRDMFSCCISNCVYVLCIDLAWDTTQSYALRRMGSISLTYRHGFVIQSYQ